MSDFLNKVKGTITTTSRDVASKAKETTETIKINSQIKSNEHEIEKQFYEIGKKYYEMHQEACDVEFEEYFNKIEALKQDIQLKKEQLTEIKGVMTCSECGQEVPKETSFCSKCGARVEEPVQETEETMEETEETGEEVIEQ